MCRHLAYLGEPLTLAQLLVDPPWGLLRQSYEPRRQAHGRLNADGFGVGWFVAGDPEPVRYRRDRPIWSDANLIELARVTRSGAVLAAVRSATAGMGHAESAAAPFKGERWLFSHNGAVAGFPQSLADLATTLPTADLLSLDAPTDAALLWALVHARLRAGLAPADAVRQVVLAAPPGRLNLLLTDGESIVATTWGDTLSWRADHRGVLVASEPTDDTGAWHDVPDRHLLTATPDGVALEPLTPDGVALEPLTPDGVHIEPLTEGRG